MTSGNICCCCSNSHSSPHREGRNGSWFATMIRTIVILSVIVLLVSLLYNYAAYSVLKSSVVEISTGKVQGVVDLSRAGHAFEAFMGIPYAKPPVGRLRFQPPEPVDKWDGILDAAAFGSMCTQVDNFYYKVVGSEDCLFINVYRPKEFSSESLPVMVYVHGGYFMTGGSHYHPPHYFMDEQIILVTFNYRLGALGFLSMQDKNLRGNMGLKDQTLALKWVQENIVKFGGDPERVTVFGESAGAAAVHFHLLSPMSKGLFRKAISQSGTAIKLWSLSTKPKEQAKRLGKRLKCPVGGSQELLNCLLQLSGHEIIETQLETITPLLKPLMMYGPTVEPPESVPPGDESFLPDHPYTLMSQGKFHKVPWITGTNADEGLLLTGRIALEPDLVAQIEYNWEAALPEYLVYPPENKNVTKKIIDYYGTTAVNFGEKLDFKANFKGLTDMMTDRLYLVATREAALRHAQDSPVYIYYYKHHGEQTFTVFFGISKHVSVALQFAWKLISRDVARKFGYHASSLGTMKSFPQIRLGDDRNGVLETRLWPSIIDKMEGHKRVSNTPFLSSPRRVCHGDELFLFFKVPYMEVKANSKDFELSRSLIRLWVQFAYDETKMTFNGIPWEPVPASAATEKSKLKYLTFEDSNAHGIKDEEFTDRIEFWKKLNLPWII